MGQVVAREPFGRLEELGSGLFAFISTPLGGDYTTVCNGGIIQGREGVMVVEAFMSPQGAEWMARKARELTGRWPTHVLVTHYHSDHTTGAPAYPATAEAEGASGPELLATAPTRDLRIRGLEEGVSETHRRQWADVVLLGTEEATELDLGDRALLMAPRRGHTASDVTLELPADGVTFCGDLVWNGMFPNYMDAVPGQLSRAVRAIRSGSAGRYVPGHGPLADPQDMDRYLAVLDGLEETARRARKEGWTAEEAGRRHTIPRGLGEWTLFNPSYFQRAVEAWMTEWSGGTGV